VWTDAHEAVEVLNEETNHDCF